MPFFGLNLSLALSLGGTNSNMITVGPYASRPAPGGNGNIYIASDGVVPAVDDGSAWRPICPPGVLGTQPPAASTWTNRNLGQVGTQTSSATKTDVAGTLHLYAPTGGGQLQGIEKTFVNASG